MRIWGDYSIPNPRRRFVSSAFVFVHANHRRYRRANFLVADRQARPPLFFKLGGKRRYGERETGRVPSERPVLRARRLAFAGPENGIRSETRGMDYRRETGWLVNEGGTVVVSR